MAENSKGWVDFLREQYPKGSRVQLTEMNDPFHPVPPGTMGTLKHIDDIGTFHVAWDNGQSLGLVIGEDRFTVSPPQKELMTMKLYMPLSATLSEYGDWDEPDEDLEVNGAYLVQHENAIVTALLKNRMTEEAERGIMHWYGAKDSVNDKVHSVTFNAEVKFGQLWGVAECRISEPLDSAEMDKLKDYISGQASDGWGEGFEQREIPIDNGKMYVHLWSFGDDWSIKTEEECFSPKLSDKLPEVCFSVLPDTGELINIRRGVSGYYHSDFSTNSREANIETADEQNARLGVTPAQRQAMEVGSMFGWDVPGADPAQYEIAAMAMEEM